MQKPRPVRVIENDILRIKAYVMGYPQVSSFHTDMSEKLIKLEKELTESIEYDESLETE
jgi:hypothetical protein